MLICALFNPRQTSYVLFSHYSANWKQSTEASFFLSHFFFYLIFSPILFVGAKLLCLNGLNLLLHCIYAMIQNICFYEPVCPFLIYSLTQSAVGQNLNGKALNRKFYQMLNLLLIFGTSFTLTVFYLKCRLLVYYFLFEDFLCVFLPVFLFVYLFA